MDGMAWLSFSKQFVLILFFCVFSGILIWTYRPSNRGLEQYRNLPFQDGPKRSETNE